MWMRVVSSWVCMVLYMWSLMAPVVLPDRCVFGLCAGIVMLISYACFVLQVWGHLTYSLLVCMLFMSILLRLVFL
jgi:Serine incorporator (Serinc)